MPSNTRRWLSATLQGTTVLGITLIAVVWISVAFHLDVNRRNAFDNASQTAANLARTFEEHIARTIRGEDGTLVVLRAMYERHPGTFSMIDWPKYAGMVSDVIVQYSVIDRSGILVGSSLGRPKPLDLGNREHFRFHLGRQTDELFIGKPSPGSVAGKDSIELSRRLHEPDGSFGGVIVASLDPAQLIRFYETIDVGRDGSISMVGTDGYVRARRGLKNEKLARLPLNRGVMQKIEESPTGTYMNDGKLDGVLRLVSYRKVENLPLIAVVGLSTEHVLARYEQERRQYIFIALCVTGIVAVVMLLSIAHRRKLDIAYDELQRNESLAHSRSAELRTTLENIEQGILMADASGNLQVINRRAIELLDLPPEWLETKPNLKSILCYMIGRGEFGSNGERLQRNLWDSIKNGGLGEPVQHFERTRPNGTVLEINAKPLPDGGVVRTYADITERKRAQANIARMATHDELTGLANRTLFRERVSQAIGRAQRYGETFSILLFDLDRFKEINDTCGHPAGDAVLKEAARRLSLCVREHDTVARLGGDEFAILQTKARTDEEVTQLAQRIIKTIRVPFELNGAEIILATSIGIALAPRDGADYEQLIKKADQALYQAKEGGGNYYCFCRTGVILQAPAGEVVDFARAVS